MAYLEYEFIDKMNAIIRISVLMQFIAHLCHSLDKISCRIFRHFLTQYRQANVNRK